jgi:hypothetical protein
MMPTRTLPLVLAIVTLTLALLGAPRRAKA